MSASPAATPVTIPLALTPAILLFDEDQLARLVTGCGVPSANVAVAENCAAAPVRGADPETATETTAGAVPTAGEGAEVDAGLPVHASSRQPAATPANMTAPQRAAHVDGLTISIVAQDSGPRVVPPDKSRQISNPQSQITS